MLDITGAPTEEEWALATEHVELAQEPARRWAEAEPERRAEEEARQARAAEEVKQERQETPAELKAWHEAVKRNGGKVEAPSAPPYSKWKAKQKKIRQEMHKRVRDYEAAMAAQGDQQ